MTPEYIAMTFTKCLFIPKPSVTVLQLFILGLVVALSFSESKRAFVGVCFTKVQGNAS